MTWVTNPIVPMRSLTSRRLSSKKEVPTTFVEPLCELCTESFDDTRTILDIRV